MTMQIATDGRQGGMALIVSLLMLLSLTLLGLGAMQNTSLEERMAGNMRAENLALQAAEAALRAGEDALARLGAQPVATSSKPGADGVWEEGTYNPDTGQFMGPYKVIASPAGDKAWWEQWDKALWTANGVVVNDTLVFVVANNSASIVQQSVTAPRYVIEQDGYSRDHLAIGQQRDLVTQRHRYQITGRGTDSAQRSEVLLSSTYARRF
jgi:type IV pilus assembly protein PilX